MAVYILTKEPFHNGMAAVQRIKCYARAMMSANVDCKIIIWKYTDVNGQMQYKGTIDGIPYQFVGKSTKRANNPFIGRVQSLLLQLWLPFFLLFNIKKNDIVFSYGLGSMLLWRFLIFLLHKKKVCYISELCELPFGTSTETSATIKDRAYYYKHMFPIFDGVIPISDALAEIAKQYCNPKCLIQKIPILVDYDKYNLPDNSSLAEYPYMFHSGTLYEQKDGILGMIEAFGIATQKLNYKIHFVLTGSLENSPHSKEIQSLIEKYQLHNVIHFTGYLSNEDLKDKLSKSSLVVINKYTTQQNKYCFSTKLGEYMAAGKPIIITRVGEAMNWLKDNHDCLVVDPEDINQLSKAIIKIFSDRQMADRLGNQARETCLNSFDYRSYGKIFTDIYKSLTSSI